MLSSFTSSVKKTFQDAKISESIQSGMNSVKTKLNDPNLQNEVKEKAQAGWSWLSSTAGSLWSAAKEAASTIANEMNEQPGAARPATGSASTPRSAEPRTSAAATPVTPATPATPVAAEKEMDDDDWMEAELKKAKWARGRGVRRRENLKINEEAKTPEASTTPRSGGLKISNDAPSQGHRRHHSHRHSHKKR